MGSEDSPTGKQNRQVQQNLLLRQTRQTSFIILIIIEMLVYQNDYLTIDSRRNDCNWEWLSTLFFTITIQCNWKLRRSELDVLMEDVNIDNEQVKMKGWFPKDRGFLNVFTLIKDLGYEIPVWRDILEHSIKQWYSDVNGATLLPMLTN